MGQATSSRYTVVYEGDPSGVRILSGETPTGRAVRASIGDLVSDLIETQAEVRRLTRERDAAVMALQDVLPPRLLGEGQDRPTGETFHTVMTWGALSRARAVVARATPEPSPA